MFRIPVSRKISDVNKINRKLTSSSYIRNSFIEYFIRNHQHNYIKSSSVMPLCDPTVPFVNAGMNQFKGVFLGSVEAPCQRAVNSQKCIRVGGKHNDLDVVGKDGHHHTFFEMLGNWSFGDYYKKDACRMAWDLLLGPFRLKPEDLLVTYFGGDITIGLQEDRECRDIWKSLGVSESHLQAKGVSDNFWEMGATGPCGACTELHYIGPDGSLTEIWNLVFIDCIREADGSVKRLPRQHVDTGMGLERMAALLQGVPSNYHTDLFRPLLEFIQKNSKGTSPYGGRYTEDAVVDQAYRRLADHARMISICLADDVFPATSLNLKQVMRKSFKMCTDVFQNPQLLNQLYTEVANTLGDTYPELIAKQKQASVIIDHEREAYAKLRSDLAKKWRGLLKKYPEVESLSNIEIPGLALGYTEFKETMSKLNSSTVPGELVFKLYDTHGFQEDVIERIAQLNNLSIDKAGFEKLLEQHKSKHKTAFKEQSANKNLKFDAAIERLIKSGFKCTDDSHKYDYALSNNEVTFKPLKSKLVSILNEDGEWIDFLDPCEDRPYYLVTDSTNFYCEEGGQIADSGVIKLSDQVTMRVDSVFKIRDFVFHKGHFILDKSNEKKYVKCGNEVILTIDSHKRLEVMKNHTAIHLLNAAIRKVLPNSVICQIGSQVTDKGLILNLSVYGEKLSEKAILEAEALVRRAIESDTTLECREVDSLRLQAEAGVLRLPGERYPERGLRLVGFAGPLPSRELCCGTHAPSTGLLQHFCIISVRGARSHTPALHAMAGDTAMQSRELFCHVQNLRQVAAVSGGAQAGALRLEAGSTRRRLASLGPAPHAPGAPCGEHAACLRTLERLERIEQPEQLEPVHPDGLEHLERPDAVNAQAALHGIAEAEIQEARAEARQAGRAFVVHFVRCSYLMRSEEVGGALAAPAPLPTLLLGCAGGVLCACATVPLKINKQIVEIPCWLSAGLQTEPESPMEGLSAEEWLRCAARVFGAEVRPRPPRPPAHYAEMTAVKVSLIDCEQMVQDAMRIAIKFAQSHVKKGDSRGDTETHSKNRQQN